MNAVLKLHPTVAAPSIASSAVLIDLSISTWTGRKLDKRASNDVITQNKASRGVANVHKKLLGSCEELDVIARFASNVRNIHYGMTMPWSDLGMRLCPTKKYIASEGGYQQTMTALQDEFGRIVQTFLDTYDWEVTQARLKLGDLFDPQDYPSRDTVADKFRFRFTAMPLPDVGDWRLDIGNDAAVAMREQYEKFYGEQLADAMKDVWQRAHKALTSMSERLDYADEDTKKVFRDTLVSNVQEVVTLLADMNVTNDPTMTSAQRQLADAISGVTPGALRTDPELRAQTKKKVDDVRRIIDNLPGFGF